MELSKRIVPTNTFEGIISNVPTFDNTKLVAINTCPMWGMVRYDQHKTMGSEATRAMALEAGSAAHEVFAAHRLFSFIQYGAFWYDLTEDDVDAVARLNGIRIFGEERYNLMLKCFDGTDAYVGPDMRSCMQQFCLSALETSGFYDDPNDRRRTMTNIEEMCLSYIDNHSWEDQPVYFDGSSSLGIELPIDVMINIDGGLDWVRFIGRADGLHYYDKTLTDLRLHENKTASRLGSAWDESWYTNHQPTGYMLALSAMIGIDVFMAYMLGATLPLPKRVSLEGFSKIAVTREQWQFEEWLGWLESTYKTYKECQSQPHLSPQYTHSCNRYFRPCSFIPLCATQPEDRIIMLEEMREDHWSPLDEVKADD